MEEKVIHELSFYTVFDRVIRQQLNDVLLTDTPKHTTITLLEEDTSEIANGLLASFQQHQLKLKLVTSCSEIKPILNEIFNKYHPHFYQFIDTSLFINTPQSKIDLLNTIVKQVLLIKKT
ncbi:hypothetical protein QTN25_001494 [Entamoeba marina]